MLDDAALKLVLPFFGKQLQQLPWYVSISKLNILDLCTLKLLTTEKRPVQL